MNKKKDYRKPECNVRILDMIILTTVSGEPEEPDKDFGSEYGPELPDVDFQW